MLKIISIAPHDFIIAAKIGLDLLNFFIFDQVLHVQHVVVGQKIRPTTVELHMRGTLVFIFLLIKSFSVRCQDTILLDVHPDKILSGLEFPGTIIYYSCRTEDTIFMLHRIARNKKVIIVYIKYPIGDMWASYHKNGNIMQLGHFKRNILVWQDRIRPSANKVKYGVWFYFFEDGKISDIRLDSASK